MNSNAIFDAAVQFLLVTSVSFVLLCLLASVIRFYELSAPAMIKPAGAVASVDAAELFQVQIAQRISTAYRTPQPFGIFMIIFAAAPEPPAGLAAAGAAAALRGRRLAVVKQALRQSDAVCLLADDAIGVLVETPRTKLDIIAQRLQAALQDAADRPGAAAIGGASYPENGLRGQVLMNLARAAALGGAGGWQPAASDARPAAAEEAGETAPPLFEGVDSLTGVLRQDQVGRVTQKYVASHRRDGRPVSLLCMDIDHLDRYNKSYGRETGDGILRNLGAVLQQRVREEDLIGRCGDDEFLVMLDCAPEAAWGVGQRLVALIKKTPFSGPGQVLKVTVSAGVAGYPGHGRTAQQLQEAAQVALQVAQEQGRNICVKYDNNMRPYQYRSEPAADKF
ncbi:MAG: GGDEF domain-containing protein [Kiritimatiellaeota bacterium]|nr:GGDEF domain-containing protein [Kiritimatiellota bacterium]